MSFGFEFDAAGLSEVDKMEKHFLDEPAPQSPLRPPKDAIQNHTTPKMAVQAFILHHQSPLPPAKDEVQNYTSPKMAVEAFTSHHQSPHLPPKDVAQGHTTPNMAGQAFTPHLSSGQRSGSVVNKFGRARERISTPIEDLEHVPLFSSTHSPVFSPVAGAFENSTDRFPAVRRSFENQASNASKRCPSQSQSVFI